QERPPTREERRPGRPGGGPARAAGRGRPPRRGGGGRDGGARPAHTEREAALADATRLRNQLHHLLLQLDPEYEARLPALRSAAGVAALEGYTAPGPRALDQERAAAVRRLAQRLRLAVDQAEALAAQIRARAQTGFVALTRLCGVSLLTAGALAGI